MKRVQATLPLALTAQKLSISMDNVSVIALTQPWRQGGAGDNPGEANCQTQTPWDVFWGLEEQECGWGHLPWLLTGELIQLCWDQHSPTAPPAFRQLFWEGEPPSNPCILFPGAEGGNNCPQRHSYEQQHGNHWGVLGISTYSRYSPSFSVGFLSVDKQVFLVFPAAFLAEVCQSLIWCWISGNQVASVLLGHLGGTMRLLRMKDWKL